MIYYMDRAPVKGDADAAEIIATNISSAAGVEAIPRIDFSFEYSTLRFGELDPLDGFIYCRREYDIEDVQ